MPLTRAIGMPRTSFDSVYFPMEAPGVTMWVVCRVSYEALQVLSGFKNAFPRAMLSVFHEHRTEIEGIASRKYDAGDKNPHVIGADVTRAP